MHSDAQTVNEYLAALPVERRKTVAAVRKVIRKNLPRGYAEGMQYGMIGYFVPHRLYAAGHHCDPRQPLPFAGLAAQKNHFAVYLMCIYASSEQQAWFEREWAAAGKKLDAGKSCIRFKRLEDVPLELIGRAIARVPVAEFIALYEQTVKPRAKRSKTPQPATRTASPGKRGRPR